jgi:hypothetical protein
MPGHEWIILSIAPTLFLLIALAKLIVQELIALVSLVKRFQDTLRSSIPWH